MAKATRFVLCVSNEGCEDLERRKLYAVVADEAAAADGYSALWTSRERGLSLPRSELRCDRAVR